MEKDLIILGAGGTGLQVADAVEDINNEKKRWNLLGYLDDDPKKQDIEINGFPVLGTLEDVKKYHNCYFVAIFGSPQNYFLRKKLIRKLELPIERFETVIHPDTTISRYAKIGLGTVILAGTRIMPNVEIGNHVIILSNSYLAHDTIVGDFSTMTNSVSIAGEVRINEGCYIGANSSIRERIIIGEWSLIGLGAVIIKDVPPYCTVVGNPGRIIKKKEPSDFHLDGSY